MGPRIQGPSAYVGLVVRSSFAVREAPRRAASNRGSPERLAVSTRPPQAALLPCPRQELLAAEPSLSICLSARSAEDTRDLLMKFERLTPPHGPTVGARAGATHVWGATQLR